ncbi:hypothetical protein L207DRAFT_586682 [Hyaloscypha variabilis F]|uniref:Cyanovirin-N domain-containing protein n=1 Tax=Hyaloscypha variabilis (strain UAMH 11265 / GT02V1 / F) TaxID=1149755 RepID=A0A2J6REQ1_HYAVF|nr:hypothetical protein L207DRAFT_586682 [Hyaloscypha variabilis F]
MQFLLPLALALLSASKAQTDSGIWNSCYSPLYEQSGTSYTGITDNPNWWLSAYCYEDDGSVNENAVIELGGCLSNNFGQLICNETNFESYYGDSCFNCTGSSTNPNTGNIVPYSCYCNNDEGADVYTEIDLNDCLGNQDGNIVC